jgi:hypothetical protein
VPSNLRVHASRRRHSQSEHRVHSLQVHIPTSNQSLRYIRIACVLVALERNSNVGTVQLRRTDSRKRKSCEDRRGSSYLAGSDTATKRRICHYYLNIINYNYRHRYRYPVSFARDYSTDRGSRHRQIRYSMWLPTTKAWPSWSLVPSSWPVWTKISRKTR